MRWFKPKRMNDIQLLKNDMAHTNGHMNLLEDRIKQQDSDFAKELDTLRNELTIAINTLRNDINRWTIDFEKQTTNTISDRYFTTLENIFRWMREFSFLDKYINNDGKTLESLRKAITQPLLEAKWRAQERDKAAQVDSAIRTKGEILIAKRKEFHDLKLKLEREGQDTKIVDAKLKVIDYVIGGANE